jgi:hypothetical protein
MPHSFSHAPLRGGKEVAITGATAGLSCWHGAYVIRQETYLPYLVPRGATPNAAIRGSRERAR